MQRLLTSQCLSRTVSTLRSRVIMCFYKYYIISSFLGKCTLYIRTLAQSDMCLQYSAHCLLASCVLCMLLLCSRACMEAYSEFLVLNMSGYNTEYFMCALSCPKRLKGWIHEELFTTNTTQRNVEHCALQSLSGCIHNLNNPREKQWYTSVY